MKYYVGFLCMKFYGRRIENGQLTDVPEKEIEISGSWSLFWLPHELARMPFYT